MPSSIALAAVSLVAATALGLSETAALAQANAGGRDGVVKSEATRGQRRGPTDAEILKLRPFKNSLPSPSPSSIRQDTRLPSLSPGVKPGSALGRSPDRDQVTSTTRAFGTFGIPFSSARVQTGPGTAAVASTSPAFLSSTYPYRAIGRLNFNQGYCSGALIKRGIVLTAAHCIQRFGSGSTINSGFQFIPAFWSNGTTVLRPYGTYNWRSLVRPVTWARGTDPGSGAARMNDIALIAVAPVNGVFAGQRAGYLGYAWNNFSFRSTSRTGNRAVAELNTLGYPFLHDRGNWMQMTSGPSYLAQVGGALQIEQGSSFTGGSSGGPWIANFGFRYPAYAGGAGPGAAAALNRVVGVTSWGAADPNSPKDNFSSRFGQNSVYPNASYGTYGAGNIGALLNILCNSRPGGSTTTLAQQGYCS